MSVIQRYVGNGGISQISVFHYQNIVCLPSPGKQIIQFFPIGTLVTIINSVRSNRTQGRNHSHLIRSVSDLFDFLTVHNPALPDTGQRRRRYKAGQINGSRFFPKSGTSPVHARCVIRQIINLSVFYANRFNKLAHILFVSFHDIHFPLHYGRLFHLRS